MSNNPSTDHAARISFEDVATKPPPGLAFPKRLEFSPDDSLVTFLHSADGTLAQQAFAFDPASGERRPIVEPPGGGDREDNLTLEEKLRRERQRMLEVGVTRYEWSKEGGRMLVPATGDIYVKDGVDGAMRRVFDAEGKAAIDPRFSPDGETIAFVRDDEIYVVPTAGGTPRQVTNGARGTGKTNGLAEFIAQEEMDRDEGYWWSKDSTKLAFVEVDETQIPVYRIMHQGKDEVGDNAQEDHRYPFAGAANARVRLGVVAGNGGDVVWMDLGDDPDIYLARVAWLPDGRLTAQIENRAQTRLDLVAFDARTGTARTLITESSETWINLHHLLRPLEHSAGPLEGGFLWGSERDGFRHLYLYDRDAKLIRQLTRGPWMVDQLVEVDEKNGVVYYTGTADGATESHLYAVPLAGGEPRRITTGPGTHQVVIDHACERFIDIHDSIDQPATVRLRALADGRELAVLYDSTEPRVARLELTPPRLVTLETRDGETLHGALFEPSAEHPKPWRTMISVYGGPHAQTVRNTWGLTADLRAQYLRQQGFLVFKLDNRGSARRGLAFEGRIKHDMGNLEVSDQVEGVEWLVAQGLADPAHVGIYGWSYGGYMSAMALARAPETFRVGVAGAPVTDWDGYDTHYTERYMGTPQSNPEGYRDAAVQAHVDTMRGKLLLVHGLLDENVHFRHTARLMNALIAGRKDYGLMLFPDERHSPRKLGDRVFMEERVYRYIDENL